MESDQWKKIDKLFHDALELDPERRAEFLNKACVGDNDLRQRLETLLSADGEAEALLDKSAIETVAKTLGAERRRWATDKAFGHYRILSMIGAGGMGEVYLADDTRLPRRVALKLLPEAFTRNRERVERFRHEARATSALNHPNIITIYEVGHEEDVDFIASEFVEGETLRKIIETRFHSVSDVLDFTIQVASALQAAHRTGVVHRDIKPENVMIRHDGIVKVLDFGLAKLITQHPPGKSTRIDTELLFDRPFETEPGRLIGTVRYMSPEQIREHEIDGRSDLFSLGVVLYEVLTGRVPFKGESAGEVMSAILTDRPLPLELAAGAATADLERIVNRALAKEPENRYQSATEILVDLNGLKDELGFEARLRRAGPSRLSTVSYASPGISAPPGKAASLEPVGGAVPLDSEFYIVRSIDSEFEAAIARRDSIVLVKGPRQVGKTSLLARGLQRARESGAKVVLTDFQGLGDDCFETAEKLLQRLGGAIAEQIDLDKLPEEVWSPHMGPSSNFERFLRREVLTAIDAPIVWGLDEVDRLFACEFGSSIFGLFRSWHNKRALDPQGPWMQLTLAIAYATEAHLFITDLNQSPFNVGTQLLLEDFTIDQVADLNSRYGSPLRSEAELALYYRLVGGHPYLVRRGLHEMTVRRLRLDSLVNEAGHDHGPFGHHLRRILVSLTQDRKLCEAVKGVLQGRPSLSTDSFFRLQSAGVIAGDSAKHATPRCQLYKEYLKEHLQ